MLLSLVVFMTAGEGERHCIRCRQGLILSDLAFSGWSASTHWYINQGIYSTTTDPGRAQQINLNIYLVLWSSCAWTSLDFPCRPGDCSAPSTPPLDHRCRILAVFIIYLVIRPDLSSFEASILASFFALILYKEPDHYISPTFFLSECYRRMLILCRDSWSIAVTRMVI